MRSEQQPIKQSDRKLLQELLALEPTNHTGRVMLESLTKRSKTQLKATERTVVLILRDSASKRMAEELLLQKKLREYLCPALLSASDDVFELSKIITPILLGLVAAGTISIPIVPVLFASVALLASRMGVATLCGDSDKKKKAQK